MRMRGYDVLHPMGWDAFGLPTENAAIETGRHPADLTREWSANYKRQLDLAGGSYDWAREINSTHPEYYRWTQWMFLKLYERGLAYRATGLQWWCPICGALANEEVNADGTDWRDHAAITQRELTQWFFKITDYADQLIEDLDGLDWPEETRSAQINWIGRSEGTDVTFTAETGDELSVFTTRPRHALRRHLHGAGAGASAGQARYDAGPRGRGSGLRGRRLTQGRTGARGAG